MRSVGTAVPVRWDSLAFHISPAGETTLREQFDCRLKLEKMRSEMISLRTENSRILVENLALKRFNEKLILENRAFRREKELHLEIDQLEISPLGCPTVPNIDIFSRTLTELGQF